MKYKLCKKLTPKDQESKEVEEVHDSKTPKKEEVEEVVELQEEEPPKRKNHVNM